MSTINQYHTFELKFDIEMEVFGFNNYSRMFQLMAKSGFYGDETLGRPVQEFTQGELDYSAKYEWPELPEWVFLKPFSEPPTSKQDTPPNLNF